MGRGRGRRTEDDDEEGTGRWRWRWRRLNRQATPRSESIFSRTLEAALTETVEARSRVPLPVSRRSDVDSTPSPFLFPSSSNSLSTLVNHLIKNYTNSSSDNFSPALQSLELFFKSPKIPKFRFSVD